MRVKARTGLPCVCGNKLLLISRPGSAVYAVSHAVPKCGRTWRAIPTEARIIAKATASLSYKDAGVDIDAGTELVRRIQKLNPSIGGFSGFVPFGTKPDLMPCLRCLLAALSAITAPTRCQICFVPFLEPLKVVWERRGFISCGRH